MPIGTACVLISTVSITFPTLMATVLAVQMMPGPADAWAVLGAAFATMLVMLDALQRNMRGVRLWSVGISSAGCGAFLPGMIAYNALPLAVAEGFSWHAWAVMGAVCAGVGTGLVHGVLVWNRKRAAAFSEDALDRLARVSKEGRAERGEIEPPTEKQD